MKKYVTVALILAVIVGVTIPSIFADTKLRGDHEVRL